MQHTMRYKVIFNGGDRNGAERYYTSISVACRVAGTYVTRCRKKFGLCDDSRAEVYYITSKGKAELMYSY